MLKDLIYRFEPECIGEGIYYCSHITGNDDLRNANTTLIPDYESGVQKELPTFPAYETYYEISNVLVG